MELTSQQYEFIGRYLAEHLKAGATVSAIDPSSCLLPRENGDVDGKLTIKYENEKEPVAWLVDIGKHMTRNDIIRMAKEAELHCHGQS